MGPLRSTSAAAIWTALVTGRFISTERLISSALLEAANLEGGAALFPRHVLRWLGGMWVALLVVSLWAGTDLGIWEHVAVLVGVPSAYLTGIGVARMADRILPVPEEMLEAFGHLLLPEGFPLWQILLFLSVPPLLC